MSVTVVDKINAAVALSPVGTWFRLEGCGHPKERTGSRFLVSYDENPRSETQPASCLDRTSCWHHHLGKSPE